jgi:hypothetical protein
MAFFKTKADRIILVISFALSIFSYGSLALSYFYVRGVYASNEQVSVFSWVEYFLLSNEDLWFAAQYGEVTFGDIIHLAIHFLIVSLFIIVLALLPFFFFRSVWRWVGAGR